MKDLCHALFRKQDIQLRKLSIILCIEYHEKYYFNILNMIILLYHMYIENEIYHTASNKVRYLLNDHLFIEGKLVSNMIILHPHKLL